MLRRWDGDTWLALEQLGDPTVLEAICAPPESRGLDAEERG
jgi:hypothetical protein